MHTCHMCIIIMISMKCMEHTFTHVHAHTVPSGPPTDVQAEPGASGSVHVSWTGPVSGATGYAIYYRPTNSPSDQTQFVLVNNGDATSYTVEGIKPETEYTVQMLTYAELPTTLSNTATVFLDGEYMHTYIASLGGNLHRKEGLTQCFC